ncbi:hypothetical protein SUDANB176_02887 [Streptomyces sp. enrichment culture]
MHRPTVAQFAYGSCTVVFSTFAMLLLSRTGSVVGIALVAVAALALGLLVAMTVPLSRPRPAAARRPAPPEPVRATVPSPVHEPVRERAAS